MRKLLAVLITCVIGFTPVTASASNDSVVTLSFSGSTAALSTSQKKVVQTLITSQRVHKAISCRAFISKSASTAVKSLATKRAKAVCDQAKQFAIRSATVKTSSVLTTSKAQLGKVELKASYSTAPNKPISLTNLDPIWTEEVAWKKVQEFLITVPESSISPTLRFTAGVSSTRRAQAEKQINLIYRFWSPYFKPQASQIDALFWHDKDLAAAQSTYEQMLRGRVLASQLSDGIIYGKTNYCAHAASLQLYTNPQTFVFHQCVGSGSDGPAELQTTPHEYTHFVHFQFGSMPIWLTEGSATFYGEALGIYPADYGRRALDSHRNSLFQSYDIVSGKSVSSDTLRGLLRKNDFATVKKLFASLEVPQAQSQADNTAAYLLGSLATCALVATFGHEAFVEFMKSFSTSANYSENFSKAFGLTPNQFYEYLTPYLANNPSVRG